MFEKVEKNRNEKSENCELWTSNIHEEFEFVLRNLIVSLD